MATKDEVLIRMLDQGQDIIAEALKDIEVLWVYSWLDLFYWIKYNIKLLITKNYFQHIQKNKNSFKSNLKSLIHEI
jgi:hypothetical protein